MNGFGIIATLMVAVMMVAIGYGAWFRLTHRCAEVRRVWQEASTTCTPNYQWINDQMFYMGDICTESPAHWDGICSRWERRP